MLTTSPKKRTIWFVNHYAGNMELGMEYRHFYLARHLKKAGHNVVIISGSFHHLYTNLPQTDGQDITYKTYDDIPYAILKTRPYQGNGLNRLLGMLDYTRGVNKFMRQIAEQYGTPDAVIGSTPHPFVHYNLQRAQKIFQCKTLFEVRDLWPQMLIELGSLKKYHPLSLFFYYIERQAHKKSDRTISLWHSADEYMFKHGLKPENYIYLPNGIELDESTNTKLNDSHPVCQKVKDLQASGKFVIGYGGSHGHANAISCAAQTCRKLKDQGIDDIAFVFVGNGPDREKYMAEAKELGVFDDNMFFFDYVTKDVILAFYDLIDTAYIGLIDLPLFKYSPTPNKLMDYFAMAKPIIFAINARYKPVEVAKAGVSIAPTPDELFTAALTMRDTKPSDLQQMGKNGRQYAERELSFQALSEKLMDEIENI